MSNTPLPEPAFGFLVVSEETGQWIGSRAGEAAFDADNLHAHAAAVSAAKDAEIAGLQIKADLFDLAVRKGLLSVHSELIDPRNHSTRCSWLEGHAKACDISNNAARAALGDSTSTTQPPSPSPRS